MREKIERILREFATDNGLNFASGIVPSKLSQGIKYPCMFWVLPDGEYSVKRSRRVFRNTLYFVDIESAEERVPHSLDELERMATEVFELLHTDEEFSTADNLTTRTKIGFDNSGAHAIEAVFDTYGYYGDC